MEITSRIKIAAFLVVAFAGIVLFLAIPRNALAVDDPTEGYGWAHTLASTGASNTVIYQTFDVSSGAALSPDNISITIVEAFTATPYAPITYSCSSACPTSNTFSSIPTNHPGGQWAVYSTVCKTNYHCSQNPGMIYAHQFSGTNVWTYQIFLNLSATPYKFKMTSPAINSWVNYDPTYQTSLRPSSAVPGNNAAGTRVQAKIFTSLYPTAGPVAGPFPKAVTVPVQTFSDGWHGANGLMQDNASGAFGGNALSGTNIFGFGIDKVAPTSTCSITTASPLTLTSPLSISLSSTDSSGDPTTQANVFSGEIQSSPDGTNGWANVGTVTQAQYSYSGSGNKTASYTFSTTPAAAGTYFYRYRARDTAFNSSGTQTQWGSYADCGSIDVVARDFTVTLAPNSREVTNGQSTTYTATVESVNGFAGDVNLAATQAPADATITYNWSPATVTVPANGSVNSTLTVTTTAATAANFGGNLTTFNANPNSLPNVRTGASSVVYNGYVYTIGGYNGNVAEANCISGYCKTVFYAPLNADGSIGSWTTSSNPIPAPRYQSTSVVANGYVYVIGGNDGASPFSTVFYAPLNADGSTGSWTTSSNPLPVTNNNFSSVVANGYVYVIGGNDWSTYKSTVYYAKLNSDGSTGSWITNANALPSLRSAHTSVVANGYVYVIGGTANGSTYQSTVYYAKLNCDGSTGTWTTSSKPLPVTSGNHSSVVNNGYVYVLGGYNGAYFSTVYYAKLNTDGTTGAWGTSTNPLPGQRSLHNSVVNNGRIYLIGGADSTTRYSSVYYAVMNTYTITVTGVSGVLNHSTTALLTVLVGSGDFTISTTPCSATVQQGEYYDYSVKVTSVSSFVGSVTLSIKPADLAILTANSITPTFNTNPVIINGAGSSQLSTLTLQTATNTPVSPPTYSITVVGTSTTPALSNSAAPVSLLVTKLIPKPWVTTTKGDVGSEGNNSDGSINLVNPSSSSYLILGNFSNHNFTSAKNWLITDYQTSSGGINDSVLNSQYDYLLSKLAGGSAQDWPPSCFENSEIVGGLPLSSCILLNTNNTGPGYGGVMANNGVFKYKAPAGKPDLLYNIQAALDATHLAYDTSNWNGDYAGKDLAISGNPTVIFVPGKLQINRPIITTGNKKLVFVVQGDVEINPTVRRIDATIITNGVFKDFVWLNQRNQTRYNHLSAIEDQLKKYYSYVSYYPFHAETDTSDGCASKAPYPGQGWWWELWGGSHGNVTGNGTWDGTNPNTGANNFQYDSCPATPPSATGKAGLRWHLSVRNDLPAAYYPTLPTPRFELNNYLDPINGKNCGSAPYTNCYGKRIATPKAYAYRYWSWWPGDVYCYDSNEPTYNQTYGFFNTCATAYELSFNAEDDGYLDRYGKIETILYTLCGGDYNRRLTNSSFLESGTGGYSCGYWPLQLNGAVIAQGGFSLQRDLRDDNGSSYTTNHPPVASEVFNFDPSIYYYLTQDIPGIGPLLAVRRTYSQEVAP